MFLNSAAACVARAQGVRRGRARRAHTWYIRVLSSRIVIFIGWVSSKHYIVHAIQYTVTQSRESFIVIQTSTTQTTVY